MIQAIRAEIAALQEESKKQTAKLTSAVESLRSEIKCENERLAKNLGLSVQISRQHQPLV